jgi:Bacterial Ig domain
MLRTAVVSSSSIVFLLFLAIASVAFASPCPLNPASPSVTVCTPINGGTFTSPVNVVAGTTDNSATVTAMAIYVDNQLATKQNVSEINANLPMSVGAHYIVVQAWDNAGNIVKTAVNITVASDAPFGFLDSARGSDGTSTVPRNSNLLVSGWAADKVDGAPVAKVVVRIDGNAVGNATLGYARPDVASAYGNSSYTNSGWQFSYNVGNMATGPHNVTAVAYNHAGVSALLYETDSINVTGGDAPFGFQDTAHGGDGTSNVPQNSMLTVVGWAADQVDGAPVAKVAISIDNNVVGNATLGYPRPDVARAYNDSRYTNSGWQFSYNIGSLVPGTHTVTSTAYNQAGATTTLYTYNGSGSFTVPSGTGGTCTAGSAAPSVTICSPANGSSVTSPVHVVAVPNSNTGVTAMAVYFDNSLVYSTNSNKVDTTINADNGSHYVVVQFWDNNGKVPAKASENITVSGTGGGGTATVDVATAHNDPARDGANTNETVLTPANVNPAHFGKIVGYGVDGQVYAQPLLLSNFSIGGGTNNVLYVATEHDSVYAFNADDKTGTPYWSVSLLAPGQSPASSSDTEGISPQIGITGTPVIDRNTNAIYLVSMVYVSGAGNEYWLHALDLATGQEKFGGPVRINPTVSGSGFGNVNGHLTIEGGCYQRVGLALANGIVYTTFGHCTHGWVVGYNENTLQLAGVYNSSPNGKGASIWMSGGAPPVDSSGNLYLETGVDADSTTNSGYSDSFIKLSPGLSLLDYFQVSNNAYLTANDADLGSGAPIIMPDNASSFPHEVIGAGKDGRIFVVNRDNMGQFDPNADHVIQVVQSGVKQFDNFFDQPAYWNGYVYYHAEGDVLRQFKWSNGLLSTSPVYTGSTTFGTHGATPSVSSSGTSNGIVWELQVDGQPNGPAVLHAYDATDVSNELYNSSMNSGDAAGPAVKFTVPTIANGKVYVPAGNQVDIYGPK